MDRKNWVRTSWKDEDVQVLLKDITGKIAPMTEIQREERIQSGVHYSELLPKEYMPSEKYLDLYKEALELHAEITAKAVISLGELIWEKKQDKLVLVSLARAGTPIGVLLKHYLESRYAGCVEHYSVSIIRDRELDPVAMEYILERHEPEHIRFIDGWVGKGTIAGELRRYVKAYPGVCPELAVLADPTGITELHGTKSDFLIPSSCLNGTVSGLFSRTVLNDEVIHGGDFHGAVFYEELESVDRTYEFIGRIEAEIRKLEETMDIADICEAMSLSVDGISSISAEEEIQTLSRTFGVENINLIKPGIGETTRVLMRRVPEIVLVGDLEEQEYVGHIIRLCREKNVELRQYPLKNYKACGIIRHLTDV